MHPGSTPFKECTKCGVAKPATTEFWQKDARGRDGLRPQCKACCTAWNRASYYRNHERNKARMLAHKARRGLASQTLYDEFRSRGCSVCGVRDIRIIEAHHVNSAEKECNLRARTGELITPEKMIAELERCIPLCCNHHRIITVMQWNGSVGEDTAEAVSTMREEWAAEHPAGQSVRL